MKKAAIAAAIVLLFLVANRGAYKGYFQDDDLDNLAWTRLVDSADFAKGLVSPVFSRNNFRPVGHFYFHLMGKLAGLRFEPYVAVLQFFHLVNGGLLWLILRRLKIHPLAALFGTIFFLYHPATFDAYWQPMYIFDVLCGTFCLLSFLTFIDRRWVISFLCFFCAYKAKEVAVMLPAVLAVYEFIEGERKWKPLVPFFGVSLLFGVQALISNANTHDAYTLRVTWTTLLASLAFYAPRFFGFNIAVFTLVLTVAALFRNRRAWLGLAAAFLFLIPLLVVPGRTFSVYLYVPLIGAAVIFAALVDVPKPWPALLFIAIWVPITFVKMRDYRRGALTVAADNRSYVAGLQDFLSTSPQTTSFLQDGAPVGMHPWGINGAIRFIAKKSEIQLAALDEPEAKSVLAKPRFAVLSWDAVTRKLQVTSRQPDTPDASFINMRQGMPVWQFGDGWYHRENAYRWTKPIATASLLRPPGANAFDVTVNINRVHLQAVSKIRLEVLLDGASIGAQEFTTAGWQTRHYSLRPGAAGLVKVELHTTPEFHPDGDPRVLGIAVGGFGFLP